MRLISVLTPQASSSVSASSEAVLWEYRVPGGVQAVIKRFGNEIDNAAAWGSVAWYICKNGLSMSDNIYDQVGLITDPKEIEPIEFEGGTCLQIKTWNGYGSTVKIGFSAYIELWGD